MKNQEQAIKKKQNDKEIDGVTMGPLIVRRVRVSCLVRIPVTATV